MVYFSLNGTLHLRRDRSSVRVFLSVGPQVDHALKCMTLSARSDVWRGPEMDILDYDWSVMGPPTTLSLGSFNTDLLLEMGNNMRCR